MNYNEQPEQQTDELSLRQILDFFLGNWHWFLISIISCLAVGYIYTKTVTNQYESSATIRIDENYKRESSGADIANLTGGLMMKPMSSVENEVLELKSRRLMTSVVARLNANISYYREGKLRLVEQAQIHMPIEMILGDSSKQNFTAEITLSADSYSVKIDDDKKNSVTYGSVVNVNGACFSLVKQNGFEIKKPEDIIIKVRPMTEVVSQLLTNLSVAPASKTSSIVNISLVNPVPQLSADIINGMVDVYNIEAIFDKRLVAQNTADFIEERLKIISGELSTVDSEVESFKKANKSVNIQAESGIFLQNVSVNEQSAVELSTQIMLVEEVAKYLNVNNKEVKLLPSNIGIEDPGLNKSIELYNTSIIQRERLMGSGDQNMAANPVIQDLDMQISSMKQSIKESIVNLRKALALKERSLETHEGVLSGRVKNVPTIEKEAQSIIRQQNIKEAIYLLLLNKREENGLRLAATVPIAKVIDSALPAQLPISPRVPIILMIAFFIGIVIPVAVLLLIDQLRTSIRNRSEIERSVSVPILGEIPSKDKNSIEDLVVGKSSRDIVSEAFRIVRTNLDFVLMGNNHKVVMITSTIPNDGKTFVAMNLAVSLGITGKRVLFIDVDMRKTSTAMKLKNKVQIGMSNYLAGKEDNIKSLIDKNSIESVDIIFAGTLPPNPAELVVGDRFTNAIEELKNDYDYIIIDTPPIGVVADGTIINRVADVTLYVVRIGHTNRRFVDLLRKIVNDKKLNNLSLILTDVKVGRGSGYGYGYGYGAYGDNKGQIR